MKIICRVGIDILLVAIAIGIAVLVDSLDFVARWLGHLEPYKENLERGFYFLLLFPLLWRCSGSIKGCIRNMKVNAGGFGFEVEVGGSEKNADAVTKENEIQKDGAQRLTLTKVVTRNNGREISRRILNILSDEMNLDFTEEATLKRSGCHYHPDGYAEKNRHAYIVEIKVYDDPLTIRRAISEFKNFISGMALQVQHTTVILCIYSSRPSKDFKSVVYKEMADLNVDFMYRVFSKETLEKV